MSFIISNGIMAIYDVKSIYDVMHDVDISDFKSKNVINR